MTNLKKLALLTKELEWHENNFIDYVTTADYSIILISETGTIKWCNQFFLDAFEETDVVNKNLFQIIGVDINNNQRSLHINNREHIIKIKDLHRNDKLIHKKVTIIPHE